MTRLDVKAIRRETGLTQIVFAERFGFPLATLRHWEQGQKNPSGAARTLLIIIGQAPAIVQQAVERSRTAVRAA